MPTHNLDPYADHFDWTSPKHNALVARWPELCDMVAYAMVPALDRLIADDHAAYPAEFTGELEGNVPTDAERDEAAQRWRDILTTIKAAFEAHIVLSEEFPEEADQYESDRDEGLLLFAEFFPHLWS